MRASANERAWHRLSALAKSIRSTSNSKLVLPLHVESRCDAGFADKLLKAWAQLQRLGSQLLTLCVFCAYARCALFYHAFPVTVAEQGRVLCGPHDAGRGQRWGQSRGALPPGPSYRPLTGWTRTSKGSNACSTRGCLIHTLTRHSRPPGTLPFPSFSSLNFSLHLRLVPICGPGPGYVVATRSTQDNSTCFIHVGITSGFFAWLGVPYCLGDP